MKKEVCSQSVGNPWKVVDEVDDGSELRYVDDGSELRYVSSDLQGLLSGYPTSHIID
jgi:hypothetical protein